MKTIYCLYFFLLSSALFAQNEGFLDYAFTNEYVIANSIVCQGDEGLLLLTNNYDSIGRRAWSNENYIIEISADGVETRRALIAPDSIPFIYDSELLLKEDSSLLIAGVGDDSTGAYIWLGSISADLELANEKRWSMNLPDTALFIQQVSFQLEGDKLFVFGIASHEGRGLQARLFSAVIDVAEEPFLVSREITKYIIWASHATKVDNEWIAFSSVLYVADSLMRGWTPTDRRIGGLTRRTSLKIKDDNIYAFGGWTGNLVLSEGGILRKIDRQFAPLGQDIFHGSVDRRYNPGRKSLVFNENNGDVYVCGAFGFDPFVPTYPFQADNSTISLIRYDEDVNRIFEKTYGGDASYDVMQTKLLPNGRVAICGFRYYDETDVMEGFLLVVSGEDGAITSEYSYPVGRVPLKLFPNPAEGYFQIKVPDGYPETASVDLSVYDIAGREVLRHQGIRVDETIGIEDLPLGAYTVVLVGNGQRFTTKLIKR